MLVFYKWTILSSLMVVFRCYGNATIILQDDTLIANHSGYIKKHFKEQLTNPEKRKRKAFSQFGYNLSYFPFPVFPISKVIKPGNYGLHYYGKTGRKEKNGALYTCRGGFIDFTHVRAGIDWCVYISFRIISEQKNFELPAEAGTLKLEFRDLDHLTTADIASVAQKIAYERLTWHEIASWHYHKPNFLIREQMSAFTPEDLYSNLLGTFIGKRVVLRILKEKEDLSYSDIVTEEINAMIKTLLPVTIKSQTRRAFDLVDRNKQLHLPESERNTDIWWDSHIVFRDERYIFKRDTAYGESKAPWLLPHADKAGCLRATTGFTLQIPQVTSENSSLNKFYTFTISPDSILFFSKWNGEQIHEPFKEFNTTEMKNIIAHIGLQMEKELLKGFGKRNKFDPVPYFNKLNKVIMPLPDIPD